MPALPHLVTLGTLVTLDLLEASYREPLRLAELRQQFLQEDYVPLPDLLTPQAQALIAAEVDRLQEMAKDRDFRMAGYDTPRLMATLGGRQIYRESSTLASLYAHYELRTLVATIVGGALYPCRHPEEFMVLNYLAKSGSTHGWHLDDPAYALVIVLEAPPRGEGGLVEIIPNWTSLCRELGVPVGKTWSGRCVGAANET